MGSFIYMITKCICGRNLRPCSCCSCCCCLECGQVISLCPCKSIDRESSFIYEQHNDLIMGTTASSLILGILGIILTIIGIVLVIFGIIDLIQLTWIMAIIYIIVGAVLIWIGVDVIGWPSRGSSRT